jgi:SAM-dependent methyltransferase
LELRLADSRSIEPPSQEAADDRRYLREMDAVGGESSAEWDPRLFYERQEELSGAYSGDVSDHHRAKAELVAAHCGRVRRVLELGAGGGQMAVATAELGFDVVAVELVPGLAEHARALASDSRVDVVEGDFYLAAIEGPFGAVCYWDGFGIGTDRDQRTLLARIREWLAEDGRALIDVYTPRYWADAAGREMTFGDVRRRYEFDSATQTMIDRWWREGAPEETVAQHLRCYAPDELARLLDPVGLSLEAIEHDGALDEAMTYTAVIRSA